MVLLSGLAGLLGTRLLVENFRGSAVLAEQEATTSARLRAEVIAYSILVTSPTTVAQQRQVVAAQTTLQDDFTAAIAGEVTTTARNLLAKCFVRWDRQSSPRRGPRAVPPTELVRGAAVSTGAPEVLALLDRAGSANRVAVHDQLARAATTERDTMVALALLVLLAIVLALRLARRLSTEVLRPVGVLRDSANQLGRRRARPPRRGRPGRRARRARRQLQRHGRRHRRQPAHPDQRGQPRLAHRAGQPGRVPRPAGSRAGPARPAQRHPGRAVRGPRRLQGRQRHPRPRRRRRAARAWWPRA